MNTGNMSQYISSDCGFLTKKSQLFSYHLAIGSYPEIPFVLNAILKKLVVNIKVCSSCDIIY